MQHCASDMRLDEWKGRLRVIPDCIASLFTELLKLHGTETWCGPLYKGLEHVAAGDTQQSRIKDSPLHTRRCFGSSLLDTGRATMSRINMLQ